MLSAQGGLKKQYCRSASFPRQLGLAAMGLALSAMVGGLLVPALAGAAINPVPLPSATCPSNLNSCTANDVVTIVRAVSVLNGDACNSTSDTIDLRITTQYATTANQRYDLGLFVSGDGGTVQEPSTALICYGAAALAGQGNDNAYPGDADTDLFLSLDPSGHSATPTTTDTCGDLSTAGGPVDWTVDVTVACSIVGGQLTIPSCRVWEQNANHQTSCTNLQQAGTGSKCDCNPLVVTANLNPCAVTTCNDSNECTSDSCTVINRVCQNGTNNGTSCTSDAQCTGGGNCGGGEAQCVYTPKTAGTPCGDQSSGDCKAPDACDANGVCQTGYKSSTTICRNSAGQCDVAESCTGTSVTCPANGFASATTTCVGTSNGGACDGTDSCNGAGACVDGFKSATTTCRPSAGQCDVAESCTGDSGACPPDAFQTATTACVGTSNGGPCDGTDSCSGTANSCVDGYLTATTTCRPSAGQCDVAESCTGDSGACPADGFLPMTTICRQAGANPDCDPAESCAGNTATCPADPGDQCTFRDDPSIEPTNTTCQLYASGTTAALAEVQYNRKGNQPITSSNPGVFFLYDGVHLASAGAITVTEANFPVAGQQSGTPTAWTKRLPVQGAIDSKPQVIIYNQSCVVLYNWSNGQTFPGVTLSLGSGSTLGNVVISGLPAGDYIISVKYNADVAGCTATACKDNGTTYTFSTTAGGSASGSDSIPYNKKK